MELKLYTVLHPIGPDDCPGQPEGWRWAIHTDTNFHQWKDGCIMAGQEANRMSSESALSIVLLTGRRMLTAAGCTSSVEAHVLADCPFTADMVAELAVLF